MPGTAVEGVFVSCGPSVTDPESRGCDPRLSFCSPWRCGCSAPALAWGDAGCEGARCGPGADWSCCTSCRSVRTCKLAAIRAELRDSTGGVRPDLVRFGFVGVEDGEAGGRLLFGLRSSVSGARRTRESDGGPAAPCTSFWSWSASAGLGSGDDGAVRVSPVLDRPLHVLRCAVMHGPV